MIYLKNLKLNREPSDLEKEIARLFAELNKIDDPSSEKYIAVSDQLKKLYALKEIDSKRKVSPDAVVGAVTNLAGMVLIINYERVHVITTKALGMVGRKVIG